MVEIEHDFEVALRRSRGLVHDRDLFLLGAPFERVAQAEHPGRDDSAGCGASKTVDRALDRMLAGVGSPGLVGGGVRLAGVFRFFKTFRLVSMQIVHPSTVRPISGIAGRRPVGFGP
jgi:hypothetical protein